MDSEQTRRVLPALTANRLLQRAGRPLTWVSRHPYPVLALIIMFAATLGAVKLWIDPPSFEFNWENRWWQIAVHLSRGEGYTACKPLYFPFCGPGNQVTAMREPLPVLLFALIARLTHESLLVAAAAGVAANLATIVAVFLLTREVSNGQVGLLAGLLWAAYLAPVRLLYNQVSGDLLAALCLTTGLFLFMRAIKTNRTVHWLAAGGCIGLAALSRSAFLAIGFVLAAGLFLHLLASRPFRPRLRADRLRPLAIFTLALGLTISPWFLRNFLAFRQPVIGSTLSGYYLFRQNHMLPQADYARFVTGAAFYPVLEQTLARRTDLLGTENEAQLDQVYRQEALRIIRSHPVRYVVLSTSRFLMLWFNWRVDEEYGKQPNLVDRVILLQHGLLLFGAALGLAGRLRRLWPLAACVAAYHLLYMAVMAHLPYLIPIMPLMVSLGAVGLTGTLAGRFQTAEPNRQGEAALPLQDRTGAKWRPFDRTRGPGD